MSGLVREMVSALADELAADPVLAETVAVALAPYLPDHAGGWLSAQNAADYLGLGSPRSTGSCATACHTCSRPARTAAGTSSGPLSTAGSEVRADVRSLSRESGPATLERPGP